MAAGLIAISAPGIASSAIRRLPHPRNVTTVGIDGLYFYRGYLIATQTDVKPNRVTACHLAPSLTRIDAAKVLERADPRMSSPTEGTIVGSSLPGVVPAALREQSSARTLRELGTLPANPLSRRP